MMKTKTARRWVAMGAYACASGMSSFWRRPESILTLNRSTMDSGSPPLARVQNDDVRIWSLALTLAATALTASTTHAQEPAYPVKPIRFLVGQAPGGATDIVGRLVAAKMTEALGQNIV